MPQLGPQARRLALEVFAEVRAEWGFATDVIARAFRTHRELGSADRRRVAETVYGLVRMNRRLEAILDEVLASWRLRRADLPAPARDELLLTLHELREGESTPDEARATAERLVRGLRSPGAPPIDLRLALDADAGLRGREGHERDAVRLSYPTWIIERFIADLGRDAALALADAMNRRAPMTVRANLHATTRDDLVVRLRTEGVEANPTPLSPAGLRLETRVNAFGLPAFRDGLFEVMDEGSQLVAELVAPPPGGRVVDACAGAGGKSLAVADALDGKGRLLALDTSGRKLEELRRRSRRAGYSNVLARPVDAAAGTLPPEAKLASWDRVLVDAPCSGLGTLRRNPEARWRLAPGDLERLPVQQLGLLFAYAPLCAPAGRLIYATCTVLADENERVVERFLAERGDFERVAVKDVWGKARAETVGDGQLLRVGPHTHDTDGFFAAVMRRKRPTT